VIETHQLFNYADSVSLLGRNKYTIKEERETLLGTSMEAGIEINIEKTEHRFMSYQQRSGQNHNVKVSNKSVST
jgi:hypothetical protein